MNKRASGILLHVTSLPSAFGVGDFGPAADRFLDFLSEARQSLWQILPLNPTELVHHESPYHGTSAFAGNPLLISPELLAEEGLLSASDLDSRPVFPEDRFAAREVRGFKDRLLDLAYEQFRKQGGRPDFEGFCAAQSFWLEDFALFTAIKSRLGGSWDKWPSGLKHRSAEALADARRELAGLVEKEKFVQYVFARQWLALKRRANGRGVRVIGDMPIYVNHSSADVWVHPDLFKLDEGMRPAAVAGVPPDYFSQTGQLWGNPVYRWERLRETGYDWWFRRVEHNLALFDAVRIDHFRGLVAYWEVPAVEKTAMAGRWVEVPARDFFERLAERIPSPPLIAEDLGIITDDVRAVMDHFHFPGMRVLLFAFGPDMPTHPYNPHNYPRNCVAYTGTHDNNTVRGWFEQEATSEEKSRLFQYLGREVAAGELPRELIRQLMMSAADTVIFPLQDVLGLGGEARMNTPSTVEGNWAWRLTPGLPSAETTSRLREMTETFGRE